jgi:hypothetical protein
MYKMETHTLPRHMDAYGSILLKIHTRHELESSHWVSVVDMFIYVSGGLVLVVPGMTLGT